MNIPNRLTAAQLKATLLRSRSTLISTLIHAVVLFLAFGVLHRSHIAPFKLPGTAHGLTMLTYYAAGSPPHAVSDIPQKAPVKQKADTSHAAVTLPTPKLKPPAAPATQDGTGNSPELGIGEGDIKIAQQTYFPYPRPSLSSLPHGTSSDVVLDAVIDEHGKISDLKLVKSLGQPIDDVVIATVKQWSFAPATRNGVPIPSEQELHFHYERS
jgi:periplasmic protein TonB